MALDAIINVSISNTTVSVSQQGFGTPLVLGFHTRFTDRFRAYSSLTAMVADGFATTDAEYKAVAACFAQNPKPVQVIVGRRLTKSTQTVEVTPIAVNNATYKVTINGTVHTYVADGTATVAEICTGLTTALNGGAQAAAITATDNVTKITIVSDTQGLCFAIETSATDSGELRMQDITTDAGWATDLGDLLAASAAWYAIVMTSKGKAEILAAAAWAESNARLLLSASGDYDVRTAGGGDLATSLKTSAYTRTALMWHHAPGSYPEAAWAGKLLPEKPGAATWAYKTLAGIAASPATAGNLNDTAIGILEGKNCNYYTTLGGVNITRVGKVESGEWIDIMIGLDWLKARIQERLFARLAALKKIPYTEAGVTLVATEIRAQLLEGSSNGLLVSGSEVVAFPAVTAISSVDKGNRLLPSGTFSALLAGAIHSINVVGTVSV